MSEGQLEYFREPIDQFPTPNVLTDEDHGKWSTTSPTQKTLRCEQHKRNPLRQSTYSPTCGAPHNRQTSNELPEKVFRKATEVAAEVAAEVTAEVTTEVAAEEEAAEEETLPSQEGHPWVTQEEGEEKIGSSDNPRTPSQEIAPKQRSSSHSGSYTTT